MGDEDELPESYLYEPVKYRFEARGSVLRTRAQRKYAKPERVLSGANAGDPVRRGTMAGRFSARSKANLKLAAYSFPWDAMGRRIGMVTLTWPEDLWPDNGPEMARCRRRIVDRWEYRGGLPAGGDLEAGVRRAEGFASYPLGDGSASWRVGRQGPGLVCAGVVRGARLLGQPAMSTGLSEAGAAPEATGGHRHERLDGFLCVGSVGHRRC